MAAKKLKLVPFTAAIWPEAIEAMDDIKEATQTSRSFVGRLALRRYIDGHASPILPALDVISERFGCQLQENPVGLPSIGLLMEQGTADWLCARWQERTITTWGDGIRSAIGWKLPDMLDTTVRLLIEQADDLQVTPSQRTIR